MRVALPVSIALLVACGSDDEVAPGPSTPLTSEAAQFVKDLCAVLEPCCATGDTTSAACASESDTFGRGKTYDAVRAAACLADLRAVAGGATFCTGKPETIACAAVFKPLDARGEGTACRLDDDCANGPEGTGLCLGAGDKARCRFVTRGKAGDACLGTRGPGALDEVSGGSDARAVCFLGDGLVCDADARTCVPRGVIGATCSTSLGACVDEAWCSPDGTCVPRSADGESCASSEECEAGSNCGNDGEGNGVCLARVAEGGACPDGNECDAALTCDPDRSVCTVDRSVYAQACAAAAALAR